MSSHLMQCMEVFGGNQAIDNAVSMPGLDAWVFSSPHVGSASGGDVHYVSSCATGRISRFLVADVSGHGAAVSEIAVALRSLMRRHVNTVDQKRLIESLNREFIDLSDDGAFASAIVGTYWAPTDYLVLTNAGHPRPLHWRAATQEWKTVDQGQSGDDPANIPLGVFEPARYDQLGITLERGDLILVYTDALIEARDPAGKSLGEDGLLALLGGLGAATPETLIGVLRGALERSGRTAAGHDDLTLLLVHHTGTRPPRMTAKAWWNALREFGGMARGSLRRLPWPDLNLANLGGAMIPSFNKRWSERAAARRRTEKGNDS